MQATISFVRKVAASSVIALNTLLTLFVMYLWAWAKPGSPCIPNLFQSTKDSEGHAKDSKGPASSIVQALISALPFIVFPFTISASGMDNALQNERGHLGTVAALCLGELIVAVILGARMLTCVTGWSTTYVGLGAAIFSTLLVLAQGVAPWGSGQSIGRAKQQRDEKKDEGKHLPDGDEPDAGR